MNAVGYHEVSGFDHRVRVVTDAPANEHGQRFVAYRDGCAYVGGYMYAPADLRAIPADCDDWRSAAAEAIAVAAYVQAMPAPRSVDSHIIDG